MRPVTGLAERVGGVHGVELARGLRHVRIGDGRDDVDVELGGVGQIEARQPAHHRDAAPDGVRSGGGREQRQKRPLVQDPDAGAARRSVELIATTGRPDRREPVVVGVVGADLLGGGAVDRVDDTSTPRPAAPAACRRRLEHLVDEADRLGRHGVVVSAERRVDVAVLVELGDAVDPQPLAHHAHQPRASASVVQQAPQVLLAAVRGGHRVDVVEQLLVGRIRRHQVRQEAGGLVRCQSWSCRAGSRRCCRPARSGR